MAKKKVVRKSVKKEVAPATSEDSLLEVAMGVKPMADIVPEKFWDKTITSERDFILYRREARRAIYKIIKNMKLGKSFMDNPRLKEMYELISPQVDPNMGIMWSNFASKWDLHPKDITKIVLKEHWIKEGGGFDAEIGTHAPTAFTGQKQ